MNQAASRIFVYGTLLRGGPNHHLLAEARFVGEACSSPHFQLVNLGHFPAMLPGGETAIEGEVYAVGPRTLARLDRLEGHPRFYTRTAITLSDGQAVQAYILPRDQAHGAPVIPSGSWRTRATADSRA